jgi:S1-C subfamily serine protease
MEPAARVLTAGDPDETMLSDRLRPIWQRAKARWTPPKRSTTESGPTIESGPTEADPAVRTRRPLWLGLLLLVVVLAVALWQFRDDGPAPITKSDVDRAVAAGVEKAQKDARNTPPDATTAFRQIQPSLVTVTTSSGADEPKAESLGAGVVINAQGAVLTALHVVSDGPTIQVRFADGTEAKATIASSEPDQDIAVLTVDTLPQVVVPAVMGGGAQVGAAVYPVGNPLGLEGSLTAGVVSALDRSIKTEDGKTLKQLIQFDAAVNPGNSGGPLLDRNGHVIGIVTALANPSKQAYFIGIGFAVPIRTAAGAAGGPSK